MEMMKVSSSPLKLALIKDYDCQPYATITASIQRHHLEMTPLCFTQPFNQRKEWWILVVAILQNSVKKVSVVFLTNQQLFLPSQTNCAVDETATYLRKINKGHSHPMRIEYHSWCESHFVMWNSIVLFLIKHSQTTINSYFKYFY